MEDNGHSLLVYMLNKNIIFLLTSANFFTCDISLYWRVIVMLIGVRLNSFLFLMIILKMQRIH